MIQLHGIRYSIGARVLFDDLTWVLAPGDRVALVGPNGAGKTTLLRILLGEYTPEAGNRVLARGTRIGYLPQEAAEKFDGSVLDRALDAHRAVLDMRSELDALHQDLAGIAPEDPRLESLLERAGELQHHLEMHDEHALEPEARRVLSGLGFSRRDQDRPMAEFSGGWRMRATLAALLLTDPTLLFLDEPTNHLDLPAMEWLEDYLEDFHGGLVVVSHDRVFLDRVADTVRELDRGELTEYATSFTGYLEEREARRDRAASSNEQLDKKIAQLTRFVERFGAKNTLASQAQSKRKMIARLEKQRVILPRKPRSIRFQFPAPPHSGRTLVRLREASFGYGAGDVFSDASLDLDKGDKVAIVGANGAGKTTLLRLIAGQLAQRTGTREIPAHTKLAYFAQHAAEVLDGKLTVLESLEDVASMDWQPRLRGLLGSFLFEGDDVFKHVRVLSGGERQRVALARILLEPANLLLLDEPTHHLDLAGKEVLENALSQYPGAVVVVTHDRSLMASLATRVIEVEGGRVRLYPGGYDDYEAARIARAKAESGQVPVPTPAPGPGPGPDRASGPAPAARAAKVAADGRTNEAGRKPQARPTPAEREQERKAQAAKKRREREAPRIEKEIEEREREIGEVETLLADPAVYADGTRARDLVKRYEVLRSELDSLWQKLEEA
ncbi:MAG: ABC-F family ATP-binding cassette domain-containing protein [Candidatus Eiseniibacteriota bacterium]